MKTNRNIIFVLAIMFAILIQLAVPTLAYADGETEPPPPTKAATEPPPPTEEPATEVAPAESVATESPAAPQADVAPIDDPNASIDTTATEDTPLLEVIQELPAQTGVVVLDENGQVVPLATQEAADIIAISDPMWCPASAAKVTADCVPAATVSDLLTQLIMAPKSEDGVIYFAATYTNPDATIDGSNPHQLGNYALTLQGGWDGNTMVGSTITYSGQSVFSVPITLTNWTKDITVNDITVSGTAGDGLTVTSSQGVTIADSTFENNTSSGVYIFDVRTVTINNSHFRENKDRGLNQTLGYDNVTITNSTFTMNGDHGAYIGGPVVNITNSIFDQNGDNGVSISAGGVTITDSTFNRNKADGMDLHTDSASIANNTFTGNVGAGLTIFTYDNTNATVENNTFSQNGIGISAISQSISPTSPPAVIGLTLKCNTFRKNETDISLSGNVKVTNKSCGGGGGGGGGGGDDSVLVPPNPDVIELFIDCSLRNSYLVQWASGDQVLLSCVDGGTARISRVDNTTLPRDMPAGFEYASGFSIEIFQNGVPLTVLPDGGFIQFGFASRHANPQYGIIYWDEENGDWIQLKDFQIDTIGAPVSFPLHSSNQQDEFKILSGARYILDGNRYREEVTTNFTGIFVLVQY